MEWSSIESSQRDDYNSVVSHPLQSYEWGEFREQTGVKVVRRGLFKNGKIVEGFTITIHKVPKTKFTIGYFPKGTKASKDLLGELVKVGKENNCIFIQLEPNMTKLEGSGFENKNLQKSFHPLFTKFTFVLDLSKSEDELLKSFHPKTRYNIKVAKKHSVIVAEDDSDEAFKEYLRLTQETTTRQKFYAHTPSYHKTMWQTLRQTEKKDQVSNKLSAHLFTGTFENKVLTAWILFVFKDTLYYPYGASSSMNRNTMSSNLVMWEAILFGKRLGLKKFDMWGALGKEPNTKDPWYGFHKFKEGYGAVHTEFLGSYDLIINPIMYNVYKVADKARWLYLRIRKIH